MNAKCLRLPILAALVLCLFAVPAHAAISPAQLVNKSSSGVKGNDFSFDANVSDDGRYVVFTSSATNLVDGSTDSRNAIDVFRFDRATGTTEKVSVGLSGAEGDGASSDGVASEDGRYIAFSSTSSNLVSNDTNGVGDVFVRDMVAGQTERVSVGTRTSPTSPGVEANDYSGRPSISNNGRRVAFETAATNLAPDSNGQDDVFVRTLISDTTTLVSQSVVSGATGNGRSYQPSISGNGRTVAYTSYATDLDPHGTDTNVLRDIYLNVVGNSDSVLVSISADGMNGGNGTTTDPTVDDSGKLVAFTSAAENLTARDDNGNVEDIFLRNVANGITSLVSHDLDGGGANAESTFASLSGDGKVVTFESGASDLVTSDTNSRRDIFAHAIDRDVTMQVSGASESVQANGSSNESAGSLSGDGSTLAFNSWADNLTSEDPDSVEDSFVRTFSFPPPAPPHDPGTTVTTQIMTPSSVSTSPSSGITAKSPDTKGSGTTSASTSIKSTPKAPVGPKLSIKVGYLPRWPVRASLHSALRGIRVHVRSNKAAKLKHIIIKVQYKGKWRVAAQLAPGKSISFAKAERKTVSLKLTKLGKKVLPSVIYGHRRRSKVSTEAVTSSGETSSQTRSVLIRKPTKVKKK